MKVVGGKNVYLIKWKGYPANENTWEPTKHLNNSMALVKLGLYRYDLADLGLVGLI